MQLKQLPTFTRNIQPDQRPGREASELHKRSWIKRLLQETRHAKDHWLRGGAIDYKGIGLKGLRLSRGGVVTDIGEARLIETSVGCLLCLHPASAPRISRIEYKDSTPLTLPFSL
jgi:hypothetical protein